MLNDGFITYAEIHLSVDRVMNFITNISPLSNKGGGQYIWRSILCNATVLLLFFFYKITYSH